MVLFWERTSPTLRVLTAAVPKDATGKNLILLYVTAVWQLLSAGPYRGYEYCRGIFKPVLHALKKERSIQACFEIVYVAKTKAYLFAYVINKNHQVKTIFSFARTNKICIFKQAISVLKLHRAFHNTGCISSFFCTLDADDEKLVFFL